MLSCPISFCSLLRREAFCLSGFKDNPEYAAVDNSKIPLSAVNSVQISDMWKSTAVASSAGFAVSVNIKAFDCFSLKCKLEAVTSVEILPVEWFTKA